LEKGKTPQQVMNALGLASATAFTDEEKAEVSDIGVLYIFVGVLCVSVDR